MIASDACKSIFSLNYFRSQCDENGFDLCNCIIYSNERSDLFLLLLMMVGCLKMIPLGLMMCLLLVLMR